MLLHKINFLKHNTSFNFNLIKNNSGKILTQESVINTLTFTEKRELAEKINPYDYNVDNIDISELYNQSPFNNPFLMIKWYAHNDINKEKIEILHANQWLSQSKNINNIFEEKENRVRDYHSRLLSKISLDSINFIEREVNSALLSSSNKIQKITNSHNYSIFNNDTLILAFTPQLINKLITISENATKYLAEEHSMIQDSSDSYRRKIFNSFPALYRQITQAIHFWKSYLIEFASHLSMDFYKIQETFFSNSPLGEFISINTEFGDTHNHGRYTFVCNFSCGKHLVYKPRSQALDHQFYRFLDYFINNSDMPDFYQPTFLLRDNYGWMEYIEALPCDNDKQIADYYYRSGCLLSILYLLEAEDIHTENVIARKNNPVIVDFETLFHLRDDAAISPQTNPLDHTVLKTHFIPQYASTNFDLEPAAIIAVSDNNIEFIRNSLPSLSSYSVPVNNYTQDFISGFEVTYHTLLKLKNKLTKSLREFIGLQARYVARPTEIYCKLMNTSYQPYFQQSGLKLELFYEKLWLDTINRPFLTQLINTEKKSLILGDVPFFGQIVGSTSLILEKHLVNENYFKKDGFSLVLEKLNRLSNEDCVAQIKIIKRSLSLGKSNKASIIKHQLNPNTKTTPMDWLPQSQIIAENIINQTSITKDSIFWPVYKIDHNGSFCLDSTNYKLHSGVLGILLYLAYCNHIIPGSIKQSFLTRATYELLNTLLSKNFDEDGCGAFEGVGGIIYVISHLLGLWKEPDLQIIAKKFIDKISKKVENDLIFDVMSGSAGAILSLLSYYHVTSDDQALNVARDFGRHLKKSFINTSSTCGWQSNNTEKNILTGFSHGIAGIAYSLMRLSKITQDSTYKDIAIKAITYEQSTFSEESSNWMDFRLSTPKKQKEGAMSAWCNGAMGIGYSRLMLMNISDSTFHKSLMTDIIRAKINTLNNLQLKNYGLCHGHFGNHEFIHQLILNNHCNEISLRQFTDNINHYLTGINNKGLNNNETVESLCLMNGLSGIGYQLLRFSLPHRIPSILMLQTPLK